MAEDESVAGRSVREMREAGLVLDDRARAPIPPHHREYVVNVMCAVDLLKAGAEPKGISALVREEALRIVAGDQPPYFLSPVRPPAVKTSVSEKRAMLPKPPKQKSAATLLRAERRRKRIESQTAMGRDIVRCAQCRVATSSAAAGPVFCCLICVGSRPPSSDELYCCEKCLARHVAERHAGPEKRAV